MGIQRFSPVSSAGGVVEIATGELVLYSAHEERIMELEQDRNEWKDAAQTRGAEASGLMRDCDALKAALAAEQDKVCELQENAQQIIDWCDAYPLGFAGGIFDEPDMHEVRRMLGDKLLTQLSAHNFRHVLNGVRKIASRAPAPAEPKETR